MRSLSRTFYPNREARVPRVQKGRPTGKRRGEIGSWGKGGLGLRGERQGILCKGEKRPRASVERSKHRRHVFRPSAPTSKSTTGSQDDRGAMGKQGRGIETSARNEVKTHKKERGKKQTERWEVEEGGTRERREAAVQAPRGWSACSLLWRIRPRDLSAVRWPSTSRWDRRRGMAAPA